MTIHFDCPSCASQHDVELSEGREAPQCFNHDSPMFGDDGEGQEIIDWPKACYECGMVFTLKIIEENVFDL